MLNEPASSVEDRPSARPLVRYGLAEDGSDEIRQMVMSVMHIEREITSLKDPRLTRAIGTTNAPREQTPIRAVYEGQLLIDSEAAYDKLDHLLMTLDALPLFREVDGKHLVIVMNGRIKPGRRGWWLNAVLFVATLFSVLLLGLNMALNEIAAAEGIAAARALSERGLLELWRGAPYATAILLILGAHELGHYFAARRHKISVTLPYFIPAPFISPIGTFGAFIQLREPMRNRKVLLDVGAAGPLSGLIFAIPILFIGLATSTVGVITPGGMLEGNSLLYALAKIITFGRFLPDGVMDVYVNQLAWAGWTGLLVTALNLIPIGQLDGGHILYSLIGERARMLYFPVLGLMVLLVLVTDAWFFWLILLLLFGRVYATPLDMITKLDSRRRGIALLGLVVFAVTFVPVPFSVIEASSVPTLPRNSVMELLLPLAVGLIALWAGRRR
jgi:membrane-associated protease RseP (regulator of RpoE activity)